MKIATYNINSVRIRLELLKKLLLEENLDILCLQETKVVDELFPKEFFTNLGYNYLHFAGEKSYNGVAIISKIPLYNHKTIPFVNGAKRFVSANFNYDGKEMELHNIYVPAGGDEPDVKINPKFQYKLDYVDGLTSFYKKNYSHKDNLIVLGDFNIAPYENDVWSHKVFLKIVCHTPIEVEKMGKWLETLNFSDITRDFIPPQQKVYTWWSYRSPNWRLADKGIRLDHIWLTQNLKTRAKNFKILKDYREGGQTQPSDHVPVIVEV
jgi:exodeoxyribonuclease-3